MGVESYREYLEVDTFLYVNAAIRRTVGGHSADGGGCLTGIEFVMDGMKWKDSTPVKERFNPC